MICSITCFSPKKSGKIYELKAGKTNMKISAKGGRIISYTYDNEEILTQSSEHENFGSTLWPRLKAIGAGRRMLFWTAWITALSRKAMY